MCNVNTDYLKPALVKFQSGFLNSQSLECVRSDPAAGRDCK